MENLGVWLRTVVSRVCLDPHRGQAAGELRGAVAVAERGAKAGARAARPALVDGAVGVVVAPRGRLLLVLRFGIKEGKISTIDAVAEPERLAGLELLAL